MSVNVTYQKIAEKLASKIGDAYAQIAVLECQIDALQVELDKRPPLPTEDPYAVPHKPIAEDTD